MGKQEHTSQPGLHSLPLPPTHLLRVRAADGFGMLTIMSVAPIISVLIFAHIRKPAKEATRQLSRAARSVNRSMRRGMAGGGKKLKYSQSTVQAAFAADAGASTNTTPMTSPDPSTHGPPAMLASVSEHVARGVLRMSGDRHIPDAHSRRC